MCLPGARGACTAPYPRTTSLPRRSGPYTARTSWGQPCGLVDLKVIDRGKFQTILWKIL